MKTTFLNCRQSSPCPKKSPIQAYSSWYKFVQSSIFKLYLIILVAYYPMTMTIFENGQLNQQQLQLLLAQIEKQLQWGSGLHWRHQDFHTLSEKILAKTGEQLSTTTLKRIWGKLSYNSLPNSHTLNTLAQFAGHENWLAFQSSNASILPNIEQTTIPNDTKSTFPPSASFLKYAGAIFLLVFLAIGAISLATKETSIPLSPSVLNSIKFSSHPVTTGVPNTIVFNYDVSKVKSDSIQIQQNWDERRRFLINKNQQEVTSTYYYPGHWNAKLVIDNQVIKEHEIYIKTEDWLTTINQEPIPRYLKEEELTKNGFLGISSVVQNEIEAATEAPKSLTYHYINEFEQLNGDNFSLDITFKNTYTKGDGVCQFSRILVDCTEGIFSIPFSIPGCVGDLSLRFNKLRQVGKNHDFSAFGCDFNQWQQLRMVVKNKHAQLYLNEQLIHEATYEESIGKVAGLKISFIGSGAIDDIQLSNAKGTPVYKEDFVTL